MKRAKTNSLRYRWITEGACPPDSRGPGELAPAHIRCLLNKENFTPRHVCLCKLRRGESLFGLCAVTAS